MTVRTTLVKEAPEDAVRATGVRTDDLATHPLQAYLDAQGFTAEAGTTLVVPDADGRPTILVGLGADAEPGAAQRAGQVVRPRVLTARLVARHHRLRQPDVGRCLRRIAARPHRRGRRCG